jgi:hypothetical protein
MLDKSSIVAAGVYVLGDGCNQGGMARHGTGLYNFRVDVVPSTTPRVFTVLTVLGNSVLGCAPGAPGPRDAAVQIATQLVSLGTTVIESTHLQSWNTLGDVSSFAVATRQSPVSSAVPEATRRAFYQLFSASTSSLDVMFGIPLLIMLAPSRAKDVVAMPFNSDGDDVFTIALRGINAWNYYRVSLDTAWLETIGGPYLRSVADALVARAELQVTSDGVRTFRGVAGPSGRRGNDNFCVNYAAATAIKAATESAYELRTTPRPLWKLVYSGMLIPLAPPSQGRVPVLDDSGATTFDSLEPLLMLSPYFDPFLSILDPGWKAYLAGSIDWYLARLNPSPPAKDAEFNAAVAAVIEATLAQTEANGPSRIESFRTRTEGLAEAMLANWGGNANTDTRRATMFLWAVTCGILGVRIRGGVTDTRFYYQSLGVDSYTHSVIMPETWDHVTFKGSSLFNENVV